MNFLESRLDARLAYSKSHCEHVIIFGKCKKMPEDHIFKLGKEGHEITIFEKDEDPLQRLINASSLYDIMLSAEYFGSLFAVSNLIDVSGRTFDGIEQNEATRALLWKTFEKPNEKILIEEHLSEVPTRTEKEKLRKTLRAFAYRDSDWADKDKYRDDLDQDFFAFNLLSDWVSFVSMLKKAIALESFYLGQTNREKLIGIGAIPIGQEILHECEDGENSQLYIEEKLSKHSHYAQYIKA